MTAPDEKQRQRERYRKGSRHQRSRDEQRRVAEARRGGGRARAGDDADEDAGFQKIRRRERVLDRTAATGTTVPNTAQSEATIVWLSRGQALVRDAEGRERPARLAPELARSQQTSVAVGDDAIVHELPDGSATVVRIAARRSELVRSDPGNEHRRRVLAANVDVVVLVLTADRPRFGLIDRLRAALAASGAELALCINKCDLAHDAEQLELGLRRYRQELLPIVSTSALRGDGIDELAALVRTRTVAMVGHSGVGKSTLLNRLDPGATGDGERAVAAVRAHDGKGRHTTTASRLRVLADGTRLIDTPGVRAFGLADGSSDALAAFADIAALADGCRFRDCSHRAEPRCAVRAAVDAGELDAARYHTFLQLAGQA